MALTETSRYSDFVPPDELGYASKCHVKREQEFLAGRTFLRINLSRYFPQVHPKEWRFSAGPFGKPEIKYPEVSARFKFNLSHSGVALALAFGEVQALGIDCEEMSRGGDLLEIAKSVFSAPEREDLQTKTGAALNRRFFQYWTLKEAFIKALGTGFSTPLDQFWFRLQDEAAIELLFSHSIQKRAEEWKFQIVQPAPMFMSAVAVVPFLSENPLQIENRGWIPNQFDRKVRAG